jgi:hypothetical protein
VGTAALIWAGGQGGGLATRWLSIKPLRWLGAHSFSLYLWHWPVLVLARHLWLDHPTPAQAAMAVLLSLGLAAVSLRWVEAPVRHAVIRERLLLVVGVSAIVLSLLAAWGLGSYADWRARQPGPDAVLRAGAQDFSPDRQRCHASGTRAVDYDKRCLFGSATAASELAVWADSHGVELARAVADALPADSGWRVSQLTASSCPPALGFVPPERPNCRASNDAILARLMRDPAVRTVVLAARYEFYLDGRDRASFESGMAHTVQALRQAGKQVILLDPVPTYHYPVPAALAQRLLRGGAPEQQGQPGADYRRVQAPALSLLASLAGVDGVQRLPTAELLCAGSRCLVMDPAGCSLYFDDNHLSMAGAARLAPAVQALLSRP